MSRYYRHIVLTDEEIPLKKWMREHLQLTNRQISRLKFQPGALMVNHQRVYVSHLLQKGDLIEIKLESDRPPLPLSDPHYPLTVLYEDEDLLVLNKPCGSVVHPIHAHYHDTLLIQASGYCAKKGETARLHCVGRLDKETSGIVLLAKNRIAAQKLTEQRNSQQRQKTYYAIVEGVMEKQNDVISFPMMNDPAEPRKMIIHENGKAASTHYSVVKQFCDHALLAVTIKTGRMHQIRVHMKAIHHPLIGDVLYGGKPYPRLCLHACQIVFYQPFTNERITISAPYDMSFQKLLVSSIR